MLRRFHALLGPTVASIATATSMACKDPVLLPADIELSGTISDSATRAVVPDAGVRLISTSRSEVLGYAKSDASGHYAIAVHIARCTEFAIAITVDAAGYQPKTLNWFDPPDKAPQCRSIPQTVNIPLQR